MVVEINTNKKLKEGDILIYEKGKFSPFNLSNKLKETEEKIEKYENEMAIFRREFAVFNQKIEDYEQKIETLENNSKRLEKVFEETIRGFITK